MNKFNQLLERLASHGSSGYATVPDSLQSPGKMDGYDDAMPSFDAAQMRQEPDSSAHHRTQARYNRLLSIATFTLTIALVALAIFHIQLLIQVHHNKLEPTELEQLDCGSSVHEAKANGCWFDELTKAWLPAECPQWGLDDYRRDGTMFNPYDNATSWPYWTDQGGVSNLSLDRMAADEDREPEQLFWTTSREHLSHCAWILKRTVYAYQNGLRRYMLASNMEHTQHCVDILYRKASRENAHLDDITTKGRVFFGTC